MTITIHRGINQIGGCITEIASANGSKILIDLGHNLPEGDNHDNDPMEKAENIDPILNGVDAVLYTATTLDLRLMWQTKTFRNTLGNCQKD